MKFSSFTAIVLLVGHASSQEAGIEALFNAGRFREAYAAVQEELKKTPDDPLLLQNGGMAAYLAEDYQGAVDLWTKLRILEPQNYTVRTKLVQAHQSLGNAQARDDEIAGVYKLYEERKETDLREVQFFCRDQFVVDGKSVMVFEYFDLKGENARKWSFNVRKKEGGVDHRYSLGSYSAVNSYARSSGELKPGQRLFHLDGYFDDGATHRTYAFSILSPLMMTSRSMVMDIMNGKLPAKSGFDAK